VIVEQAVEFGRSGMGIGYDRDGKGAFRRRIEPVCARGRTRQGVAEQDERGKRVCGADADS